VVFGYGRRVCGVRRGVRRGDGGKDLRKRYEKNLDELTCNKHSRREEHNM